MAPGPDLEALGLRPPHSWAEGPDDVLTLGRRLRAWSGAHARSLLLGAALVSVVAGVHGWGVGHAPSVTDDEGTYMSQAWAVQTHHTLAPYTYWYDHPPFGWIQIAAWTLLTGTLGPGTHAVFAGRVLMVVAGSVSALLLYLLARRLRIRPSLSAAAVALFALSPLALDYQRMVLLDNLAVPWLLGALVLAASPRRSLWAASGAGACLAASVLTKETFVLFAPALLVQLWVRSDQRTRSFCLTGCAATFVLILIGYPLFALLKGELLPGPGHVSLWQAVQFQLAGRQASGSVFSVGSNAHRTVSGWLALDAVLPAAGVAALPVTLVVRRFVVVGTALAVPIMVGMRGGYLPDPFVIGLLPFLALAAAAAVEVLAGPREQPLSRWGRPPRAWRLRPTAVLGAAAVAVAVAVAVWVPAITAATHDDATGPVYRAEAWIERNIPRDQRLIVDDSLWTDLVEHGFRPHLGVVWYYKLDFTQNLDPSVFRSLPGGYRDFAYLVYTPVVRSTLEENPAGYEPVRQALAHSVVEASFGRSGGVIQIRRITDPLPGATVVQTTGGRA